jgi:rhodanese-related sulfurtransferase
MLAKLFGMSSVLQITPDQVKTRLEGKPKPFLLDVRQPEEYRSEHIPGAHLIPLNELSGRIKELPHDREIICVCYSGNRSGRAASQLQSQGFQVVNLKGGMIHWNRVGFPVKSGMGR